MLTIQVEEVETYTLITIENLIKFCPKNWPGEGKMTLEEDDIKESTQTIKFQENVIKFF